MSLKKCQKIIEKYYDPKSETYKILARHNKTVAQKAISIAKNLQKKVK